MRGEIICIGDELISGRVSDKNAAYASSRLNPLGLAIGAVSFIGDDPACIGDTLKRALSRADFVLVTGGLGVTDDDLTAQAAAEAFGLPLAESRRMIRNLRTFWSARGKDLPREARKMACLPEGADILCADCAGFKLTAPGGVPVFFLPGVPSETRRLVDEQVVPVLLGLLPEGGGDKPVSRELSVFGLGESEIQKRLDNALPAGVSLGYYPVFPEEKLYLSARGADRQKTEALLDEALAEIEKRLGGHVVASGGEDLETAVVRLLTEKGLTLALAESCTGGLIGHRITGAPGASEVFLRGLVVYSNQAKQELLGVRDETLEKHGAVSAECAAEMAKGALKSAGAGVAVSVTGIAGPGGGTPEKPVGTVFIGLAHGKDVKTAGHRFFGDRNRVKAQSAETALFWLRQFCEDHAFIHRP